MPQVPVPVAVGALLPCSVPAGLEQLGLLQTLAFYSIGGEFDSVVGFAHKNDDWLRG